MDATQLTTKSQEAFAAASRRALRDGNPAVEPEHLLWALLQDDNGIAGQVLVAAGADRAAVRDDAEKAVASLPRASGASVSTPTPSPALQRVVATAIDMASSRGDSHVSTEMLLLGLASSGAAAADLLVQRGAGLTALNEAVDRIRAGAKVTSADPEQTFQALEQYGVDLTARARDGLLDPVIGRDAEIRRV